MQLVVFVPLHTCDAIVITAAAMMTTRPIADCFFIFVIPFISFRSAQIFLFSQLRSSLTIRMRKRDHR